MSKDIISPIAIDLGAKNTGVFYAHYEAGSALDNIEKSGKVYQLDSSSYTYLMASRTAKRHQKRGHDRRQMAKRLFKLVWENHLKLPWDKETQQAISFLMNRRGFSYLTEEYDAEFLAEMPVKARNLLNETLGLTEPCGDFREGLVDWTNEGEEKVGQLYEKVKDKTRDLKRVGFLKGQTNHLRNFCTPEQSKTKKDRARKALKASQWVMDEWVKQGIKGLPTKVKASDNLAEILEKQGDQVTQAIFKEATKYHNDLKEQEKKLKASEWGFDPENFKQEELDNVQEDDAAQIKIHLHHFAFALHKNLSELKSGGRHRSRYFEEIKTVLSEKKHKHDYLKRFCTKLQKGEFESLTVDSLTNLIGHISNLELKPLRKYFNDEKHKSKDYWCEARLQTFVHRWMLREWRVGDKDKSKQEGMPYAYSKLKEAWATHNDKGVVQFWLQTDPNFTIPPYQDNNNRRPPRCQSLLLNVDYLNSKYSGWQKWLADIKALETVQGYLDDYEDVLKSLKSGKGKPYFSDSTTGKPEVDSGLRGAAELDARVLQFILDRVKAEDPLNLNEIYSHAKKLRQIAANRAASTDKEAKATAKDSLEKAIQGSQLPDGLKSKPDYEKDDLFADGSFLHLVCKYYKNRQRARDGRVFIHPEYKKTRYRGFENTGRFDDRGVLLTYCNHKPRQKRYQMRGDLAALFQMSPGEFGERIASFEGGTEEQRIDGWLKSIEGLQSRSERCAKQQKDRRGSLKLDIKRIYGFLYHQGIHAQSKPTERNRVLARSRVNLAKELHSLCEGAKNTCQAIQDTLNPEAATLPDSLGGDPATAVHLLAQIYNIAFKERQGNANTCAVCSMDNAQRMQTVASQSRQDAVARAQRLPAIPTRVFDGAVKRIANIVGGAIAEEKWQRIKADLENGHNICIPIITESNQFEFEPSREELVKQQRPPSKPRKGRAPERGGDFKMHDAKQQRIRDAGREVCPYQGGGVGDEGQLDHILPRASSYGTINDEANLIYASIDGNKIKGNREYTLGDLSSNYKQAVFDTSEDGEIESWIIGQIGDGEGELFTFGPYRSFINLGPDQQTAFRHALFLVGHPLRAKVIRAIGNRNRAFVNGTQRFFAEVIANKLQKMAMASGYEGQVSFDYFGVSAKPDSSGDNTVDLRKEYEEHDAEIMQFTKEEDKPQQPYSHLIDAMLAFTIVADAHRNEGSLKLVMDDDLQRGPYDQDTGEIKAGILQHIIVKSGNFELSDLKEYKLTTYDVETHHRELMQKGNRGGVRVAYKIHRDTFYADKFLPLIRQDNGEFKVGFSDANSVAIGKNLSKKANENFDILSENFLQPISDKPNMWAVNKQAAIAYLVEVGSTGADTNEKEEIASILDYLRYQTGKVEIAKALTPKGSNNSPSTVKEALDTWEKCIDKGKFKIKKHIVLPVYSQWEQLRKELEQEPNQELPLQDFLRGSKLFSDKHDNRLSNHNKKRKVYSLPKPSTIGNIRLRRKSWDGETIIQTAADESLAKYRDERPHTILSENSVPVEHHDGVPPSQSLNPQPRAWKGVSPEFLLGYNKAEKEQPKVIAAKVRYRDADRCDAEVTINEADLKKLAIADHVGSGKYWRCNVKRHSSEKSRDEAREKARVGSNVLHYFEPEKQPNKKAEWKWFDKPFALPTDRGNISIERKDGKCHIRFTISQSAQVKKWI